MSDDIRTQQRWLIAAVAILAVILILVLVVIFRSIQKPDPSPRIGHRSPAAQLGYCAPEDTRLCIVSFGQIEGGDMLVNFQLPRPAYPDFTLVINRFGVDSSYECQRMKGLSTGVICTGPSQVPGEELQFKVFSTKDSTLLAAGKFSIIGIAISTPENSTTGTPEEASTESPVTEAPVVTETATPTLVQRLPTSTRTTPTVSYPPPSYPNPTSYP